MSETPTKQSSGLAIAGLVLGILAAATSFVPIVNNLSAIIAVIGGVLASVALMGALKGKNGAKGMSIAGVVLAVVSFAIVLATQSMYKAALDHAVESVSTGSQPVATSTGNGEGTPVDTSTGAQANATSTEAQAGETSSEAAPSAEATTSAEAPAPQAPAEAPAPEKDYLWLAVGESVTLQNGLTLVVNSVQRTLINYDGKHITCINVTISNSGTENESFSSYDWKSEDGAGTQRSMSYYSEAENELNSGTLSPGGTVNGNLYCEDSTTRVYYYDNMFNKSPTCGWVL